MTTLPARFRALLLTLMFLGGGTSLPSLDVLLFHLHGQTSRAVAHMESADGCASHVGHCGIGCPASASDAFGIQTGTLLRAAAAPRGTLRFHFQLPTSRAADVGFHSRAPPTLQA